jgi:hypothetical protein
MYVFRMVLRTNSSIRLISVMATEFLISQVGSNFLLIILINVSLQLCSVLQEVLQIALPS